MITTKITVNIYYCTRKAGQVQNNEYFKHSIDVYTKNVLKIKSMNHKFAFYSYHMKIKTIFLI